MQAPHSVVSAVPAVLLAMLIVAAPSTTRAADAALRARYELAAVPGVRFIDLPTEKAALEGAKPPLCTQQSAGLCDITWNSAPQAFAPLTLPPAWQAAVAAGTAQVLLRSDEGSPLIIVSRGPPGSAGPEVLLAFSVAADSVADPGARLVRWPYFNYLLYVAACAAANQPPERFSTWSHSPLPGPRTRLLIVLALALSWLLVAGLYRLARRRGNRAVDAASRFLSAVALLRQSNVAPTDKATPDAGPKLTAVFARPLSGLLMLMGGMVVLTGPYFAIQSIITRNVQPFPEADGLWRTTVDGLYIVWLTFDMGTQTAFVKYFAEHRVSHPERALADVQFYVWYQIIARLVQATLLVAFALGYLPMSSYALFAPFVLLYAAISQPAFPAVGKFLCQAIQRFDYYNLLDFLEARLLNFLMPLPAILIGRAWGLAHPEFGEAYGAALGMGVGALVTAFSVLFIGLYAMHHLGLPLGPLFLVQFRRDTVKRQLWFGFKLTLGQEPFRLTSFLESLILIRWLRDSPTWLGLRDLLHNRLTMLGFFAWGFYQSAVPVVSEALAAGKHRLLQYYVARYLQFGTLFAATIFSLLCAVGPIYIERALGAQWSQAAGYMVIASVSGLLLPWAWLTDSLQQGAGRPGTTTTVMLIEQGARLLLLMLLIQRFQFLSIYMATLTALCLKIGVAWTINHRRIVPLRIPLWPTLGAPHAAAAINYLLWRGVASLWAPAGTWSVLLLLLVAGAGSIALCFFLLGLLGGLDGAARRELDQAWRMVTLIGPLCRLLTLCAELGARLSPWQPAPPPGFEDAQRESADLEQSIT